MRGRPGGLRIGGADGWDTMTKMGGGMKVEQEKMGREIRSRATGEAEKAVAELLGEADPAADRPEASMKRYESTGEGDAR